MKKNYLIIAAIASAALVSCSSEEFVGDFNPAVRPESGKTAEIIFSSVDKGLTRAELTGADAAEKLNNQFVLAGTKGTTPTTLGKSFSNQGINFIKAESILNNHSLDRGRFAYIDEETNSLLKRSIIKEGDIVFTIAGTLGRFALVDDTVLPANTNQAVAIIRANKTKLLPEYLYSFFLGNWHNDYYKKRVQQAVQANLSLTTIKSLPIAMLSNETTDNYNRLIIPIINKKKTNEYENQHLGALRDTLLPKLMSGEIDVLEVKI